MKWCFITFRSITPAQRGEAALRRGGIGCTLQRTPAKLAQRGCGYCLRLRQGDVGTAVGVLTENRIPYSKLYLVDGDGRAEELGV